MSQPVQKNRTTRFLVGLAVITTGSAFLSIPSCEGFLTTVNPCGTVFSFCEPYEIDALFADVPDYSLDPTCSIPFYGIYGNAGSDSGTCADQVIFPTTPGQRPQGEQP
jgi:hypothetical protein